VAAASATIVSVVQLNSLLKGVGKRLYTGFEPSILRGFARLMPYPLDHQALTKCTHPSVYYTLRAVLEYLNVKINIMAHLKKDSHYIVTINYQILNERHKIASK